MTKKNIKEKWSEEAIENVTLLINTLREAEEKQKHMTEEEKSNNAIKMDGDIYY